MYGDYKWWIMSYTRFADIISSKSFLLNKYNGMHYALINAVSNMIVKFPYIYNRPNYYLLPFVNTPVIYTVIASFVMHYYHNHYLT